MGNTTLTTTSWFIIMLIIRMTRNCIWRCTRYMHDTMPLKCIHKYCTTDASIYYQGYFIIILGKLIWNHNACVILLCSVLRCSVSALSVVYFSPHIHIITLKKNGWQDLAASLIFWKYQGKYGFYRNKSNEGPFVLLAFYIDLVTKKKWWKSTEWWKMSNYVKF